MQADAAAGQHDRFDRQVLSPSRRFVAATTEGAESLQSRPQECVGGVVQEVLPHADVLIDGDLLLPVALKRALRRHLQDEVRRLALLPGQIGARLFDHRLAQRHEKVGHHHAGGIAALEVDAHVGGDEGAAAQEAAQRHHHLSHHVPLFHRFHGRTIRFRILDGRRQVDEGLCHGVLLVSMSPAGVPRTIPRRPCASRRLSSQSKPSLFTVGGATVSDIASTRCAKSTRRVVRNR